MPIKIGLFGFGRTGSVVANVFANDPKFSLEWVCRRSIPSNLHYASHALGFDRNFAPFIPFDSISLDFLKSSPVDMIIDFSNHSASCIYDLITKTGTKIVTAVSNYSEVELKLVTEASKQSAVLYSPNITLGINWLMIASKMLKTIIPHADVEIVEEHFRAKNEVSGTALRLANQLNLEPKSHVNSIRVGGIVGKHEVIFGLPHQTLRLTHESINRAAFGTGAAFAAEWLMDKENGLYSMDHIFKEKFLDQVKNLELQST